MNNVRQDRFLSLEAITFEIILASTLTKEINVNVNVNVVYSGHALSFEIASLQACH